MSYLREQTMEVFPTAMAPVATTTSPYVGFGSSAAAPPTTHVIDLGKPGPLHSGPYGTFDHDAHIAGVEEPISVDVMRSYTTSAVPRKGSPSVPADDKGTMVMIYEDMPPSALAIAGPAAAPAKNNACVIMNFEDTLHHMVPQPTKPGDEPMLMQFLSPTPAVQTAATPSPTTAVAALSGNKRPRTDADDDESKEIDSTGDLALAAANPKLTADMIDSMSYVGSYVSRAEIIAAYNRLVPDAFYLVVQSLGKAWWRHEYIMLTGEVDDKVPGGMEKLTTELDKPQGERDDKWLDQVTALARHHVAFMGAADKRETLRPMDVPEYKIIGLCIIDRKDE